tara:strand:+ start:465 stop:875 length:411 start_codon:yes stop_codon:yes gene_type:complete
MTNNLEEGSSLNIEWDKLEKASSLKGLIPVAVQDIDSMNIILLAYINEKAFDESLKRRMLVLWSSSRNELWVKGETSGNTYALIEAYVNCEQNSLLFMVQAQNSGICHTKNASGKSRDCYYRKINFENKTLTNLDP